MLNNSRLKLALKKSLALILVFSFVISLSSCENMDKDISYVKEITDADKQEEVTAEDNATDSDIPTSEEDSADENSLNYKKNIRDIMGVNYVSSYEPFNEYDIYNAPSRELARIKARNLEDVVDEELYNNRSYDWYSNGTVDEEKIYNKILANNMNAFISNDSNTELIAKTVSEVIQINLDLMKELHPDYDMDLALYAIDNLTVRDRETDEWIAYMSYSEDRIYVSFRNVYDLSNLKYTISHELFHLICMKSIYRNDVLKSGAAIDVMSSTESPLQMHSLSEFTVESYSHMAFGTEDPLDYWDTYYFIDLLCASTGKDRQYFRNCFVNNDRQGFINCFEDGYDNLNSAYAIYNAMDLSNGMAEVGIALTIRSDFDEARFQGEACNYLIVNLYKNLCIRLANEFNNGTITESEVKEVIYDFKNIISLIQTDISWITRDNYAFETCIESIDNAFWNNLSC